jgi:hypothetical protein
MRTLFKSRITPPPLPSSLDSLFLDKAQGVFESAVEGVLNVRRNRIFENNEEIRQKNESVRRH